MTDTRPLFTIAHEIERTWKPQVHRTARPYLNAMRQLNAITDKYYGDSADSIVRYFLSNAGSYKGEDAFRIKNELRVMIGEKPVKPRKR
jgi:hypothetical protein